jgi:serine/threonine protein kinase
LLVQGCLHNDFKPGNIVLNSNTNLAGVIDYGCMIRTDKTDYTIGGSLAFTPPELAWMANGEPIICHELAKPLVTPAVDMYCLGLSAMVTMFCMPKKIRLARYKNNIAGFMQAVRTFDWTSRLARLRRNGFGDLADLLAACLAKDPLQRPTAAQALQMPFLKAVEGEIDAAVAAATPSFVAQTQALVEALEVLRGEYRTFVADKPCSSLGHACISSSAVSCLPEPAAVPPAVPVAVNCSSGSSITAA